MSKDELREEIISIIDRKIAEGQRNKMNFFDSDDMADQILNLLEGEKQKAFDLKSVKEEIRYRVEQEYMKYHNDFTFENNGETFWIEQIVWKLAETLATLNKEPNKGGNSE